MVIFTIIFTKGVWVMEKEQVLVFEKNKAPAFFFKPPICSIVSGKGGVGRSFITSSLGITFAKMGLNVVLLDFDFNGANLHSWLGQNPTVPTLGDYFKNENLTLKDLLKPTVLDKLKIIHGFWPTWGFFNLNPELIAKCLSELKNLSADIVLIDLGAGLSPFQWELLKASDQKILITTPEPISIERTYRWVEKFVVQFLKERNKESFSEDGLFEHWKDRIEKKHKLFQMREYIETEFNKKKDPILKEGINSLIGPLHMILNQSRSFEDEQLGTSIKSVFNKYYFTQLNCMGHIQYDNSVWQCARQKDPVLITQPYSPQVGQFMAIAKQFINPSIMKEAS